MADRRDTATGKHVLVYFFVLAYAISWPLFILAGVVHVPWITVPGLFGPAIAAIVMARASEGKGGLRKLLHRFAVWRISPLWFVFALVFPSTSYAISSLLSPASSGSPTYAASQWYFLPVVFVGLFIVVIGEELGWRGFALPLFQKRWSALVSSLLLAIPWTIWHFAILSNPVAPNLGSISGLAFIPFVFAISVIFTAVFNNTKGSILAVLAYHASGDAAGFFLNLTSRAYDINVLVNVVVALILIVALGPKYLSRKPGPESTHA